MSNTLKIEKKIIDFFTMERVFKDLHDVRNIKFQIILARNLKKINDELDVIRKKSEMTDDFRKLLQEEDLIKRKYADKVEGTDEPIIVTEEINGENRSHYEVADEQMEAMRKEIEGFWNDEEHKAEFDSYRKTIAEYQKYITEETISIPLVKFPFDAIDQNYFNNEDNVNVSNAFAKVAEELIEI